MKKRIKQVMKRVEELLPGVTTEYKENIKNNDVVLHGIVVRTPGRNLCPTIYIDHLLKSGCRIGEMAAYVIEGYMKSTEYPGGNIQELVLDYEKAKDRLALRLVNRKENRKRLKKVPYMDFLDLAVIVVVDLPGDYGVTVEQELIESWGKTFADVYSQALSNFKKEETVITHINDVLKKLAPDYEPGDINVPLYILSNKKGAFGAVHILDQDALCEFEKRMGTDIIVIPSSIHEFILLPLEEGCGYRRSQMDRMVIDVNVTLPPEDVLSYHIYLFRNGSLRMGNDAYNE